MRYQLMWLLAPLLLCIWPTAVLAQQPLTTDQVHYFVSFFERIGSADVSLELLDHNEVAVRSFYNLTDDEARTLHTAAQSYRATMTALRQKELAIVAGKSQLSDSDRSAVGALVISRDQAVKGVATAFLSAIRPATAAQILADAEETVKTRIANGVR